MAVQIPFPIPNHGYALNSKMRVNLDFLVDKFNEFNTGSATWDTVGIGIANNETGTLTFYNASNANYLTFQAGATSPSTTFTLPTSAPLVGNGQFLKATTSGTMSWGILRDFSSAITGNLLLYTDGVGVLQEVPVGVGNKILVNSTPPSFFSLFGTSNQITVTPSVGAFTLSTPQDIGTSSNVIFNAVQSDGGTAANPGIRVIFSGASTNTGIFSSSGTNLSFSVAGVSQFALDNAGGGAFVSSMRAPAIRATTSIALSTGGSGHILTMQMPTSGGSDYTITWPNAVGGLNTVLTTDASGNLSWTSVSGAGAATTALDNLASVAINTSLLPASNNAIDLGSSTKEFRSAYLKTSLIFQESGAGTDTITIQAPSSIAAGYTLTLPVDDGTTDQVLKTDGSGVLSWASTGSLSGTVNSGTQYQMAYYASSAAAVSGDSAITTDSDNNLKILNSAAVSELTIKNTASPGNDAALWLLATGGTTGNAYIRYQINSTPVYWATGVNNGVNDQFEIAASSNPGTNARLIITTGGQVRLNNGLVGTPSLVFDSSNTDTGIYYVTTNTISITTGGADSLKIADNFIYPYHPIAAVNDGSANSPIFTFNNDADCGMYRIGTNNIAISANSVKCIDIKDTGVAIIGTNTNNSAASGFIGEYISSYGDYSASAGTSGQFKTRASISLTAGDWDVSLIAGARVNTGTAITAVSIAISAFDNNTTTDHVLADNQADLPVSPTSADPTNLVVPVWRVSISSTATYYGKVMVTYGGGTPQIAGRISARRVR